jgi:hypothetical protein
MVLFVHGVNDRVHEGEDIPVFTTSMKIDKILNYTKNIKDIYFLNNREVLMWIYDDTSFLSSYKIKPTCNESAVLKKEEDIWGRNILKNCRPDLEVKQLWTGKLGEELCKEFYTILGHTVSKPVKKENFQPDLEIEDSIIEVKTETYYTGGTAGEKILGCPFKYCEVPKLYNKKLTIVCLGGAEKSCREEYGVLPGPKYKGTKRRIINMYSKSLKIEYIGVTDLCKKLIEKII